MKTIRQLQVKDYFFYRSIINGDHLFFVESIEEQKNKDYPFTARCIHVKCINDRGRFKWVYTPGQVEYFNPNHEYEIYSNSSRKSHLPEWW